MSDERGRLDVDARGGGGFRVEDGMLCVQGSSPMMECATLTGMDKGDAARLVRRIMAETGLTLQDVGAEKPVDHSHAIQQMRLLIEHDFKYRHGEVHIASWRYALTQRVVGISKHWWDHPSRRMDIARIRSYIGAVRALERRT